MNSIKFENPYLLFIAIPLVILVVAGFFIVPKQKRFRTKNIISLAIHLVMAVTLTFSFANMQILQTSKDIEMYVLVDVSDSEASNAEQLDQAIQNIRNKNDKTVKIGVIKFAKDAKVLTSPTSGSIRADLIQKEVKNESSFDTSSTDLENALNFANNQFSENAIHKLVLISDGIETDGNAINAVDQLIKNNVELDTISLKTQSGNDIAITGIQYTDHAFTNKPQTIKVSINATAQGSNNPITVTANGQKIDVTTPGGQPLTQVDLAKGLNVISILLPDTYTKQTGSVDYNVTIQGYTKSYDTNTENNSMSFTQDYTSDFHVLFIGKDASELSAIKDMDAYKDKDITSYINADSVPSSLDELIKYDEIVLSNQDVTQINGGGDEALKFVQNLQIAISQYGKTLMTYGTTYSNTGIGEVDEDAKKKAASLYDDLLPVQYQTDDAKAIVFLIDRSGSMSTEGRIEKAKKGAIRCLDNLSEKDSVAVVAFDDKVDIIHAMTSMKNKADIIKAINKLDSRGGTTLGAGLKEAAKQLSSIDTEYKNVITLTDGEPGDNKSAIKRQVKSMASDNISCTFINISSSSGASLLKSLAKTGNGKYYYCRTAASLENVMLNSISEIDASKPITENAPYTIQVNETKDPVVTDVENLSSIGGYYYSRIKNAATTVLTVQYKKDIDDGNGGTTPVVTTVPLYAYWNYGNGKVSSFTTDLSTAENLDWTKDFLSSDGGKKFLNNSITQMLPERSSTDPLQMTYANNGKTSELTFISSDRNPDARVHVSVTSPEGKEIGTYDFGYDGANYSGLINLAQDSNNMTVKGKYLVKASYQKKADASDPNSTYQDVEGNTLETQLFFDYSKEYNTFSTTDNTLLNKLARYANGSTFTGTSTYAPTSGSEELEAKSYMSTMMFFLLLSVILYLVDIFVRKSEIFFKKKKPTKDAF